MTDHPEGERPAPQPPPDPDEAIRLARRQFFRAFVSDAVRTAANVAGVAGALRRTSAEVAGTLLGVTEAPAEPPEPLPFTFASSGVGPAGAPGASHAGLTSGGVAASAAGFRSPFRLDADSIVLLDQRRLPDDLVEVSCRTAPDVRVAILEGVIRGAPLLGQVAACAIAVAANQAVDARPYARRAILHGTANSLRNAAGSAAPVRHAVDRMMALVDRRTDLFTDGPGMAAALRTEAEAIVGEAMLDHAAIGGHGSSLFPAEPDASAPIRVLTLGSVGALAGGQVGTVLALVKHAVADGHAVEMLVCETRPALTGTRLTAWELAQAGIPYALIADAGAGALIAGGDVDVVMVGAEAIAANGDVLAEAGTCALALLAARHEVPFIVVAPGVTLDVDAEDASHFRAEPRSAHEILSFAGRRVAPAGAVARHPGLDITPAALVGAIVTESGILRAPLAEGIARVADDVGTRGVGLRPPAVEPPIDEAAPDGTAPDEAALPADQPAPPPEAVRTADEAGPLAGVVAADATPTMEPTTGSAPPAGPDGA